MLKLDYEKGKRVRSELKKLHPELSVATLMATDFTPGGSIVTLSADEWEMFTQVVHYLEEEVKAI